MSMRRFVVVKRGVNVSVIKAVCQCVDVSDINARVRCSEAKVKRWLDDVNAKRRGV